MSNSKIYKIIWTADSQVPGLVENLTYKENELAVHNRDEVLGPYREYVEAVPGTKLYKLFVEPLTITPEDNLDNVNLEACRYNWETSDVDVEYFPEKNWDDIRLLRNQLLADSDSRFNIDTPDPMKTEWVEHRQLLRDMIAREEAAGRTPETVFWHDYLPPYPRSARNGVPDDIKPLCVWYEEGKYSSPDPLPDQNTGA